MKTPPIPRPLLAYGSAGPDVRTVQRCLSILPDDGMFGPDTQTAVKHFQTAQRLTADGIVGEQTWQALERVHGPLPPYPTPFLPPLDESTQAIILAIAKNSTIATYKWRDRGQAPLGYVQGMALAWSAIVRKHLIGSSTAKEMARADTGDESHDALAWYSDVFLDFDMSNAADGLTTLRHLFVLMMGLGMRESSGQHCCGRDQSASNTDSTTCEAGLFQASWNISSTTPEIPRLLDEYSQSLDPPQCALSIFKEGVSCTQAHWKCYGDPSSDGFEYQRLAKRCPQFAVEVTALGLRHRCQHWGPIKRLEAEIQPAADKMLQDVQDVIVVGAPSV